MSRLLCIALLLAVFAKSAHAQTTTTDCSSYMPGNVTCTTTGATAPAAGGVSTTNCSSFSPNNVSCTTTTTAPPPTVAQSMAQGAEFGRNLRTIFSVFHHAPKPAPAAYVPAPYEPYHEPPPDLLRDDHGDSALVSHIPARYIDLSGRLEPVFNIGIFQNSVIVRGILVLDCHTRRLASFPLGSALLDPDLAAADWQPSGADGLSAGLEKRFCNATD